MKPRLAWSPLARLAPVALAHPTRLATALVAATLSFATAVALPAVLGFAIDDALGHGRAGKAPTGLVQLVDVARALGFTPDAQGHLPLEVYLMLLAALGLLRAASHGYSRYSLHRIGYLVEADLRSRVFEHLTRLPLSFYDHVQAGQIIARAHGDIRSLQMFLTFTPLMLLSWLSFACALMLMFSTHIGLTLATVSALPLVYIASVRMRRSNQPLSWIAQARQAELSSVVDESVQGVRVIKAFAAEAGRLSALARAAARLQWAENEMARVRARFGPMMENAARLGAALLLLYGGMLVLEGSLSGVGTLVTFNGYILMLQAPFRVLGLFLALSQRAEASAHRTFALLDAPITMTDAPNALDLPAPRGHVELCDVRFGYDTGRPVLDGLSLDVQPGETVAIVGRSGCGKSTIGRLVLRLYDVDHGEVRIDGHDVRALSLASIRATVGLAPEEPFLFSTTVRENIAYGRPDASHAEIMAAARAAQAHDFIGALPHGYDTVVGERGATLSGGQRQRIGLARLFLVNPPIVVLDDATSAVDSATESRIHAALRAERAGRTTIVIAHRESTLALATRVVLMEGGRVLATGTHTELLEREPRYATVLAKRAEDRAREQSGKERASSRRASAAMAAMASGRAPALPREESLERLGL